MAKKKQVELLNKEQEDQVSTAGQQAMHAEESEIKAIEEHIALNKNNWGSELEREPTPRRFTPKDCPMCESHRPKGLSFSRVYSTQGRIRYCRCEFCRHTWSQEGQ